MPAGEVRSFALAVVDPDPKLRTRLALQLGEEADVVTYSEVAALAEYQPPGRQLVVIFGPGLADAPGLSDIERFTRARPDAGAILVAAELSTGLLQQALRSGVRDVLGAPTEAYSLHESVERVSRTLTTVPTLPSAGLAGEAPELGRVITVSSTKGGSGKSVVATNLATSLAQRTSRPVVLVDADLQFGDVAVMMRLAAPHTLVDAVSAQGRLDAQFLQSLLCRHEPSGLLILPAPLEPSFAERVSGADMVRIVEILQSFCAYVVIDTPAQFNDVVLALIEHSDDILMVAGMDIPNIKNTKLGLQTLRMLGVPEEKLLLLLNRADSKVQLDVAEVERTLGIKAGCLVPNDIVVPQTVNKGVPVVLDAPRSDVARALERLAGKFCDAPAAPSSVPARKGRSLFGRT
ncbi:MAG: pilus assembly protein CpaE [Actinomycetota bacterium]|nr:pilus assembly protein CpaE [Actinomycetota bacterium]MDQ1501114.1 pilus assembly protein CpaE [Actinomycetota bacterium]MDQ1503755.1 pilus assembly protein CpaE [Actinomycetota bacterium]